MKTKLKYVAKGIQWKNLGIGVLILAPIIMIVAQFVYPFKNTMAYATLNGVDVGGISKQEAVERVNKAIRETPLEMYFGEAKESYRSPKLAELGVNSNSDAAVDQVMYPWWLRLVPTSLWWAHMVAGDEPVKINLSGEKIQEYVVSELGKDCKVEPKNASVEAGQDKLQLVPAVAGGECETSEVVAAIKGSSISLTDKNKVRLPVQEVSPEVNDAEAKALIDKIEDSLSGGVAVTFKDDSATFDAKTIRSWLEFEVKDGALVARINTEKSKKPLDEKVGGFVTVKPGVLTITTRDFTELSRRGGPDGRALNIDGTSSNIAKYLTGETDSVSAATKVVPAQKKYNRSYTSTSLGLSALSRHFAEDNPGTYGVSLVELSGLRRQAGYNQNRKFTTASTYKVYVAYSTLKRVESKDLKWSDQIAGGRDLAKCFDDMIVLSDNPCAEALVRTKIGYNAVHADVQALGLSNTSFIDAESFKTTAGDLTNFMVRLESGTLPISKDSRQRLINAMKRNVYRNGIPAGTPGTVADKVGFLNALLHDTAIVYGSNGTYALTILTDGSSWGNIARLTQEIEKVRR